MARKLRSLRFGFEQRTGAIYAEDLEDERSSDEVAKDVIHEDDEKSLLRPRDQMDETFTNSHDRISGSFEPYGSDEITGEQLPVAPYNPHEEYDRSEANLYPSPRP